MLIRMDHSHDIIMARKCRVIHLTCVKLCNKHFYKQFALISPFQFSQAMSPNINHTKVNKNRCKRSSKYIDTHTIRNDYKFANEN